MLKLYNGDTLKVTVSFTHQGAAWKDVVLHVAIWRNWGLDSHNELSGLNVNVAVKNIQDDASPTPYSIDIPILITKIGDIGIFSGGPHYGVLAVFRNIPGPDMVYFGPENDIDLESESAEFSNLAATYTKD